MTLKYQREYNFNSEAETVCFAQTVSLWARPNQMILLSGELGSGKSTFARAFIKSLAIGDDDFDIPSPSFSLVQTYDATRIPVAHIDLYRLTKDTEVVDLTIEELLSSHVVLIEWPERLPHNLNASKLNLKFSGTGESRTVHLVAEGAWQTQLERNDQIETFLNFTDWKNSPRKFLEGDASSRRYETVKKNGVTSILMDMPQRPDGPPVKDGKPYSAIAHLAEGIGAVIGVNTQLLSFGYSAPRIETYNVNAGLAIIENLGDHVFGRMMRDGVDVREPMLAAVEVLADMSRKIWPTHVKIDNQNAHHLSSYDLEAQLIETDLLVSWFWPYIHGSSAKPELHQSFEKIWRELLPFAAPEKPYWVMRDYHSPNLIWMPHREGIKRVGIIDTQDAVLGHPAYDLASMLQDARVDIDFDFADELFAYYEKLRSEVDKFDIAKFKTAYAVLGAQRATKILGIFARLAKRDLKPGYLNHMPRVSRYLARNLNHPALEPLKVWYETHMPEALAIGAAP
jgi:N-acetylmuramate 1-kinase